MAGQDGVRGDRPAQPEGSDGELSEFDEVDEFGADVLDEFEDVEDFEEWEFEAEAELDSFDEDFEDDAAFSAPTGVLEDEGFEDFDEF